MTDDVLQEVRAAREAFARLHGYDAHAMVAALRQMNAVGDWPVVRHPCRRPNLVAVPALAPNQTPRQTGAA